MSKKRIHPSDTVPLKLKVAGGDKFSIKLTVHQREAVVSHTRIKANIRRRLDEAESGTQAIEFTTQELDHLENELGQAAVFARSPHKQRIVAVQKKVHDILDETMLADLGIKQPAHRRASTTKSELLFQFKILLLDTSPSIWRRFQVQDGTLADLHVHIQAAMGWENYHMHQFEIAGERYGVVLPDDIDFGLDMIDESSVLLSQLLTKSGKRARWIYEYDFGDGWRHEVVFEGYPTIDKKMKYPLCIEGNHACPPEDVGGPWGYADFLVALADPDHEQHEEFMEWIGPFDPDEFDVKKATREMRKR